MDNGPCVIFYNVTWLQWSVPVLTISVHQEVTLCNIKLHTYIASKTFNNAYTKRVYLGFWPRGGGK